MEFIDLTESPPSTPKHKEKRIKVTSSSEEVLSEKAPLRLECNSAHKTEAGAKRIPWLRGITIHVAMEEPHETGKDNMKLKAQFFDQPKPTMTVHAPSTTEDGWTLEEHKSFLVGVIKCGAGDWKYISENFVKTKTAEQAEQHADEMVKTYRPQYSLRVATMGQPATTTTSHGIANACPRTSRPLPTLVTPVPTRLLQASTIMSLIKSAEGTSHVPEPSPQEPTLILFSVATPTFPVWPQNSSFAAPSSNQNEVCLSIAGTSMAVNQTQGDLPSHQPDDELDLELHLGSS